MPSVFYYRKITPYTLAGAKIHCRRHSSRDTLTIAQFKEMICRWNEAEARYNNNAAARYEYVPTSCIRKLFGEANWIDRPWPMGK